jgi:hypothetical protein
MFDFFIALIFLNKTNGKSWLKNQRWQIFENGGSTSITCKVLLISFFRSRFSWHNRRSCSRWCGRLEAYGNWMLSALSSFQLTILLLGDGCVTCYMQQSLSQPTSRVWEFIINTLIYHMRTLIEQKEDRCCEIRCSTKPCCDRMYFTGNGIWTSW